MSRPADHNFTRNALGAAYFIFGAWALLTAIYAGMEYAVTTWPTQDDVPWWAEFLRGMFENLQSEAWQVGFAAWAFKHFRWEGSPEEG